MDLPPLNLEYHMIQYFSDVSIPEYNFEEVYVFSKVYLTCRATFSKKVPTSDPYNFWYRLVVDGEVMPTGTASVRRPSQYANNFSMELYIKTDISTVKGRIYEEDPDINPDAEYIETNEVTNIKVRKWIESPKIPTVWDFNQPVKQGDDATLRLRIIDWLMYFSIQNLKVYDHESGFVLFDGMPTKSPNSHYEYIFKPTIPAFGNPLHTIVAEWTIKDLQNSSILKSTTVCSMYPRFDYGEDKKSIITDFFPLRTHNGKRISKYPLVSASGMNSYLHFSVQKTALLGRNYEETNPGAILDKTYSGDVNVRYISERTGEDVTSGSSLYFSDSYQGLDSQGLYASLDNLNISNNGGNIIENDIIKQELRIHDNVTSAPNLTATMCLLNQKNINELKFISMPPIDPTKPFYDIRTFDSEEDFIQFANVSAYSGAQATLEFTTDKIRVNLGEMTNPNEMIITYSQGSIWYTDANIVDNVTDPNLSQVYIAPLVTTNKEKVFINANQSPTTGQPVTLSANVENMIETNIGTHNFVWKKDGVVIPNARNSYIQFPSISPDDNGSYVVEYTILPKGIQAPDSGIKMVSEPFLIGVETQNPLTMVVNADPQEIVIDSPLEISGTITIATNTITKSQLFKDNVLVKTFENNDLNPKLEIAEAKETDAGVYQFRVEYTDGGSPRIYTSVGIDVTYDGRAPIDFSVDFTVPVVDDGDQATLVGKVTIANAPADVTYIYQWHRGVEGAIIGENEKDLVFESTNANDIGEYWLSVLASAPNRASTLKASPHKQFVVRQDGQLRFNIIAEKPLVADGKAAKLSMNFSANTNVAPTWDWYANGEIIDGSKDKPSIEHIAYGDMIYYVSGKPTAESIIHNTSQSNLVLVKGVVAVETLSLAVAGPTQAGLGERVLFDAVISEGTHNPLSNELNPDDYVYEWYKGTTKIGAGKEIRIYAAADAGGEYTYKIYSKVDSSISRTSPVHTFTIKEETPVSVTLPPTKSLFVGDTLEIVPTINPDDSEATYQWMKNGSAIQGEFGKQKTLTLPDVQKGDSGVYTLSVNIQNTPTVSTPCVVNVRDVPGPEPEPFEGPYYIHDLNPARNHGFTWVGWWVMDEIQTAINDNFDWLADPENARFKYKHVLKALSDGMKHWDDLEIQESRNGYIIMGSSLEVVGI